MMQRSTILIGCAWLLLSASCREDDPGTSPTTAASGFADSSSTQAPVISTTGDPTATTATTTVAPETGEPWAGTAYTGDLRGILTVTFTPAHALAEGDTIGLAGGYRIAEVGWDGAEDLYSPVAYQLALPTPPDTPDTLVSAEPVPVYDWGNADDWRQAGNGMRLRRVGEPDLVACLVFNGEYPLYRTSDAMGLGDECNPDATAWSPSAQYQVVLYGGELFEDNDLSQSVTTPPALTVTAPDLSQFDAALPADQDLAIAWEAGDDPEARIIIRVIDTNANVITVHAADDGDTTIPAAELGALTLGPLELSIARERTDRIQFSDGGLTVLSRYERWGFFDLF
ncbi:MAG: hypothetical protein AAGF11_34145 [Myxococcota bacterium]